MNALNNRVSRICIFPGHLRMTGAVRVMLNLAEALVEQGVKVDVFLTHPPGDLAHMLPPGVSVTVGRGSSVRSLPALVRYLRARRPDALLAAHQADNVVGIIARGLSGVPTKVVPTIHNDRSARGGRQLRLAALTQAMIVAYRRAYAIVAVSRGVADDAARVLKLPRNRITVIYNPTITPRLLNAASDAVDHRWLTSHDEPVVLGVGRLTKQKDFATLIRAFDVVRRAVPSKLLILGDGEDRAMLADLVRELGLEPDVDMPGVVPNGVAYISRASVLALSSRWEALPGVLIEALAVGTPVVSTDCPSGPAEILEDGRYGELVPVGDAQALGRAIIGTLENPAVREALMERGRSFSAERAANDYLELLNAG